MFKKNRPCPLPKEKKKKWSVESFTCFSPHSNIGHPPTSGKAPLKCPHLKEVFWGLFFPPGHRSLVSLYLPGLFFPDTQSGDGISVSGHGIRIKRQAACCLHSHRHIKGMGFSFHLLNASAMSWGMWYPQQQKHGFAEQNLCICFEKNAMINVLTTTTKKKTVWKKRKKVFTSPW